jgi:hypothetical protein
VVLLRAWDDPNSLPVDTTLPPNAPVAGAPATVNPYAVTPEDNLVVAGVGGLTFLQGRLAWRGELATAVHTRDRRATALDDDQVDVPAFLRGLVTPRVGTHLDYAYSSELQLRVRHLPGATPSSPRTLTASVGYRHIGPGYTSLGVASLGNDLRALDARASIRFGRWAAQLQTGRQSDNLIGRLLRRAAHRRNLHAAGRRAWNALRASLLTMAAAAPMPCVDGLPRWSLGMGHTSRSARGPPWNRCRSTTPIRTRATPTRGAPTPSSTPTRRTPV